MNDIKDEKFMRVIFSYHPTRKIDKDSNIIVGMCQGQPTFFVNSSSEQNSKTQDDAISIKKCVIEISKAFSLSLKEYAENKYKGSPLKRVA